MQKEIERMKERREQLRELLKSPVPKEASEQVSSSPLQVLEQVDMEDEEGAFNRALKANDRALNNNLFESVGSSAEHGG